MVVRSCTSLNEIAAGMDACKSGSAASTLSTVATIFAPGWREICKMMHGFPFSRPVVVDIFDRVLHGTPRRQPNRRSIVIGDDERTVVIRVEQLIVVRQSSSEHAVVQAFLSPDWRSPGQAPFEQSSRPMPVIRQDSRIQFDTYRRTSAAKQLHLADALDLRYLLGQDRIGDIVQIA